MGGWSRTPQQRAAESIRLDLRPAIRAYSAAINCPNYSERPRPTRFKKKKAPENVHQRNILIKHQCNQFKISGQDSSGGGPSWLFYSNFRRELDFVLRFFLYFLGAPWFSSIGDVLSSVINVEAHAAHRMSDGNHE